VKVPHSEDLANHAIPESCVAYREVRCEALTGVRTGQPLSRESFKVRGADAVSVAEGNTTRCDIASAVSASRGLRPWLAYDFFRFLRHPARPELGQRE
jgi:hypothetical protein